MQVRELMISVLLLSLSTSLTAASKQPQPSEPPAKQDDGPSLDATVRFIEDTVRAQGMINYELSDAINASTLNRFEALQDKCTFSHELSGQVGLKVTPATTVALKDIKKISVMPLQGTLLEIAGMQDLKLRNGRQITGGEWLSVSPPVFVLRGRMTAGTFFDLYFHDEDDPNRVAKALTHAIELCGGGNDPF